ncbi:MAG: phosphodiester glycosidase family protein [Clostridia bacterium]|nr:phosphodiester glycosidase family protein [Clostridia bacterium]
MRRFFALLLCLALLPLFALGEEVFPPREYAFDHKAYREYDSETLKYKIETFLVQGVRCYLTKVWVQDPARQIRKATSDWKKNIQLPKNMAAKIPGAALAINGSGYWNPTYRDVPGDYPGEVSDYYYTPWGSLTVTDGEVYRQLDLPYYGLTLEADGLHMYTGQAPAEVLAANPSQTWSFRNYCPMWQDGQDLLPADWSFAAAKARRTVIGRVDRNNYLLLNVTNEGRAGLTLHEVNDFFQEYFQVEWLYDLDGGPSSALLARKQGAKKLNAIMGGAAKDIDIMAFVELPAEE